MIALVALIAVAAAIVIGGAVSQSDSSAGPEAPPPSASPQPTDEVPDGTGVQLWQDPFVYACRLLPTDDVARIFGASGPKGYVRQQYLDRTPTTTELDGASAFAYGGLGTRCTHWFDDKAGHQLDVLVTQFPSAAKVERRWTTLTHAQGEGIRREPPAGRPVAGSGGRLVYLPDDGSFLIRADTLTVEVAYTGHRKDDRDEQLPLMRDVITAVDLHLSDGSAIEGPVSTSDQMTGTVGGTPYVEPCAVLDRAAFEALGGLPPEPVVVDTSVIQHDPFANTAVSSCERSGTFREDGPRHLRSTFAVLEVRVAPDPAAAQGVLERHLDNRYSSRTTPREIATDPGPAYVVDLPPSKRDPLRTRAVHVVIGAYELRLAAVRDVGPQHESGRPPTDSQLIAAVNALAEAMQETPGDVP